MTECIRVESLTFRYGRKELAATVLNRVTLAIADGEFVCLTGPSGSGKSTLLNIIGLLEHPQEGQLHFQGQRVDNASERARDDLRRNRIGFIFQDFQLLDVLTAAENVDYFLTRQGLARREREALVQTNLEKVGLWPFKDRRPGVLSGGQKQRVAIARALAKRPSLIIADEPTANLDRESARIVLQTLSELARSQSVTVIMATHDPLALEYCDRSYDLIAGHSQTRQGGGIHAA